MKLIIIFDLDDTLYHRKDFVFKGLNNVADLIFIKNNHLKKNKILNELKKLYFNQKNNKIFNDYIKKKRLKILKLKNVLMHTDMART